jgi:hypothetical protein
MNPSTIEQHRRAQEAWVGRFKERIAAGDWGCAVRGVEQAVRRLKRLARGHQDQAMDREFNIRLLRQMQENDALEIGDLTTAVARLHAWVTRLGAPADDVEPTECRPDTLPEKLLEIHGLIDTAILRCHAAVGLPTDKLTCW